MKKVLLAMGLACIMTFSMVSPIFAAGSKQDQGSSVIGTPTYTVDPEYADVEAEDIVVDNFDVTELQDYKKWDRVATEVVSILENFNSGNFSMTELFEELDKTGYPVDMNSMLEEAGVNVSELNLDSVTLLTGFEDMVMANIKKKEIIHGTNVKVTIKNNKINNLQEGKELFVLHLNSKTNQFELLPTKNVNYTEGTFDVTFPNLSPYAIVSIEKADKSVKTAVQSVNTTPFIILGVAAIAGLGFIIFKKKELL